MKEIYNLENDPNKDLEKQDYNLLVEQLGNENKRVDELKNR